MDLKDEVPPIAMFSSTKTFYLQKESVTNCLKNELLLVYQSQSEGLKHEKKMFTWKDDSIIIQLWKTTVIPTKWAFFVVFCGKKGTFCAKRMYLFMIWWVLYSSLSLTEKNTLRKSRLCLSFVPVNTFVL